MALGVPTVLAAICLGGMAAGSRAVGRTGCPPQAARTVTQLYTWYFGAGEAYRDQLDQQEARFEPALYADLQAVFHRQAGAFLDFDPFNGAQVPSFGFPLEGCRAEGPDRLEAFLLVKVGLGPERTQEQSIRVWLSRSDAEWRIRDFEYPPTPGEKSFRLQPLLKDLLRRDGKGSPGSGAEELLTPSFRVVLERHCPEGSVQCDQVRYLGQDRATGSSISLRGSTHYRVCADGMTPCRFLGYRFVNGDFVYEVSEDGRLKVSRAGMVLLEEQGDWQR